uniref:Uncharacterized protein n=1 Tax=Strigamia maritima TaxID=126957 RepID=T1JHP5_STRMM
MKLHWKKREKKKGNEEIAHILCFYFRGLKNCTWQEILSYRRVLMVLQDFGSVTLGFPIHLHNLQWIYRRGPQHQGRTVTNHNSSRKLPLQEIR